MDRVSTRGGSTRGVQLDPSRHREKRRSPFLFLSLSFSLLDPLRRQIDENVAFFVLFAFEPFIYHRIFLRTIPLLVTKKNTNFLLTTSSSNYLTAKGIETNSSSRSPSRFFFGIDGNFVRHERVSPASQSEIFQKKKKRERSVSEAIIPSPSFGRTVEFIPTSYVRFIRSFPT